MKKLLLMLVVNLFICSAFAHDDVTGKDEITTIKIRKRIYQNLAISHNHRNDGTVVVRGEGKCWGGFFSQANGKVQVRFCLRNSSGDIVELYDAVTLTMAAGSMNGFYVPCWVNAPAGEYTVWALIKPEGETEWGYMTDNDTGGDWSSWKYTVRELSDYPAPACRMIKTPELWDYTMDTPHTSPDVHNQGHSAKLYEPFTVIATLTNRGNTPLKGKIQLRYDRLLEKFWRGGEFNDDDNHNEFEHVISKSANIGNDRADADGGISVTVPAGATGYKVTIDNVVGTDYEYYTNPDGYKVRFSPLCHAYWQPEGSKEWLLIRRDNSDDFNADHSLKKDLYTYHAENMFFLDILPGEKPAEPTVIPASYDKTTRKLTLSGLEKNILVSMNDPLGNSVFSGKTTGSDIVISIPEKQGDFILKVGSTEIKINF